MNMVKIFKHWTYGLAIALLGSLPAPVSGLTAENSWSEEKPLSSFTRSEVERFLFLRQTEAAHPFSVSVPPRIQPESMVVHVVFTNSNSLIKNRSQLRLRMNGGIFAQASLDPELPDGEIDVSVPLQLIKSGLNDLSLEVAQHYQDECEDPGSPELWTSIDLEASSIRLTGNFKPVEEKVGVIDHLLAHTGWNPYEITFVPLSSEKEHLHAGTLLAQGIGLRARDQVVMITSESFGDSGRDRAALMATAPGKDLVVFGTDEEMAALFGASNRSESALGSIFLRARKNDPGHFILGVSGRDGAALSETARAFAWSTAPVNNQADVEIFEVKSAGVEAYSSRYATRPGRIYSFADLGYETTTMKGLVDNSRLKLWLSPDLFALAHSKVELSLHFTYGPSMRHDSVLNLYHNGKFVRGMSLGDDRGLTIQSFRISLPLSSFRPGINEFEFESRMRTVSGTNCETGNTDNLLLTIFDDSTISIPEADHFIAMPNLQLLTNTGFPYLGDDGSSPLIQIDSLTSAMLGSAWTLAAKIGQLKETPVNTLTVATDSANQANVFRLSVLKMIEPELWQKAPLNLGEKGVINHPTLANPDTLGVQLSTWRHKLGLLLNGAETVPYTPKTVGSADIRQSFDLVNSAAMMQFENPDYPLGTLSLVVADDEGKLLSAMHSLVHLWPKLHGAEGNLLVWASQSEHADASYWGASLEVDYYHIGSMPEWKRISYFAIQYPAFLIMLLLVIFLVMALVTSWVLRRYQEKEHPGIEI